MLPQGLCDAAEMLPLGHKRKRVQTKLFGDDFVRDDLRPGKSARRRKVMEPRGADEAQGADALLSLATLAEQAESDSQSAEEGMLPLCTVLSGKQARSTCQLSASSSIMAAGVEPASVSISQEAHAWQKALQPKDHVDLPVYVLRDDCYDER